MASKTAAQKQNTKKKTQRW